MLNGLKARYTRSKRLHSVEMDPNAGKGAHLHPRNRVRFTSGCSLLMRTCKAIDAR